LVFTFTGYKSVQKNFLLNDGEVEKITIKLELITQQLQTVTVTDDREKREAGRIAIDAQKSLVNPSPIGGIESLIKVFVGSNNELTSQYSVRGGSYDENLIYVNDFEVFRPYLVSSGQQEGLSFINPEMTGNVKFYNGGYQAKYGDKMSSVLDITYRKPKAFAGSAYVGLLEQGLHLEGTTAKGKVTYNFGMRNRSNRNLVSSQETKGNYIPSSSDLQGLLTYQASDKWLFEVLANISSTRFTLYPEESKLTSSVFSNIFTANLGLDIYFQGQEKDKYSTNFVGFSATHQPRKSLKLKWMLSHFNDAEEENKDIAAAYLFGERDFDKSKSTYGLIVNPLGAGVYLNYGRNKLNIDVWNASHKGSLDKGKHFLQWGNTIEQQVISDKLNEFQYNDSAGYSLPYNPSTLQLFSVLKSKADLNVTRFNGYVQDNIQFKDSADVILQIGMRYNYNTLNDEFLVSPRMGISFKPKKWQKDVVIKASAGIYNQPPFYRELRRYNGTVNTNLKSQKSWQISAGFDYNFKLFQRPAKLTTEAYYKNM
ncbi:MAG: TonB-dependent receptor, partial [Pedobacter sp.]|nr:TonB-dependent receptor [Chitinophagaceae bacterium]